MAELEKIWNIKILSKERLKPDQRYYELRESSDFYNKSYKSEKDAFYVEIYHRHNTSTKNEFRIGITSAYYEKYATLFPDGNYPKLLPEPLRQLQPQDISHGSEGTVFQRPRNRGKYRLDEVRYYWLSSDQMHHVTLTGTYGVTGIVMQ